MVVVADKYFADIFVFAFIDIGSDRTRQSAGGRTVGPLPAPGVDCVFVESCRFLP